MEEEHGTQSLEGATAAMQANVGGLVVALTEVPVEEGADRGLGLAENGVKLGLVNQADGLGGGHGGKRW